MRPNYIRRGILWDVLRMIIWCSVVSTGFLLSASPKTIVGRHHADTYHNPPVVIQSSTSSQESLQYDATLSEQTFEELYGDDLPEWLLENCKEYGFERPTLIQERTLDCFFNDEPNSMRTAQTGSGKSLCYLLPFVKARDQASVSKR